MAMSAQLKAAWERRETIYSTLKKNPDKELNVKDLSKMFNIVYNTAHSDVFSLIDKYGDHNISYDHGKIRYIGSNVDEVVEEKMKRYPDNKNDEGYNDPTAFIAIKTVTPHDNKVPAPKSGEVWNVRCSNGTVEKYIVLAIDQNEEIATCTPYFIKTDDGSIASCHKIYSKPLKYFIERTWSLPLSSLTAIRSEICRFFSIDPVEKIVEVKVPEEVETAVGTDSACIYTEEDMEKALLKQKAEIYEECFKMMCGS